MTSLHPEKQLKAWLPSLRAIQPKVSDSPMRLLALARIYAALYRLVSVEACDAEFGDRLEYTRRGDHLFRILLRKAKRTANPVERAALVSALFYLTSETTLAYDVKRDNTCREAVIDLLADHEDALEEPATLRCLTDFFYPKAEADDTDPWFIALKQTIRHWAETVSANGDWPEIPTGVALSRIEVMNRNSYMLLDEAYDTEIQKAYSYYKTHQPEKNTPISTLARLYDVAMQGNAYPVDREAARSVANLMATRTKAHPEGSEEKILYLSIEVDRLCEDILHNSAYSHFASKQGQALWI